MAENPVDVDHLPPDRKPLRKNSTQHCGASTMSAMARVTVAEKSLNDAGWTYSVTVDDGHGKAGFTVTLARKDYEKLSGNPSRVTPERLVEESFVFLLEREPKESILSSFALPLIGRYFPEYPREMSKRLGTR